MSNQQLDESRYTKIYSGKVQYGDWIANWDGSADLVELDTVTNLREGADIEWLRDNADVAFIFRCPMDNIKHGEL